MYVYTVYTYSSCALRTQSVPNQQQSPCNRPNFGCVGVQVLSCVYLVNVIYYKYSEYAEINERIKSESSLIIYANSFCSVDFLSDRNFDADCL